MFLQVLQSNYVYPESVTSRRVESGLNISGAEVRAIVRTLRRGGHFIISDHKGYSFTTDPDLFEDKIQHLYDRRTSLSNTIDECESAISIARQGTPQGELFNAHI